MEVKAITFLKCLIPYGTKYIRGMGKYRVLAVRRISQVFTTNLLYLPNRMKIESWIHHHLLVTVTK